MVSIENDLLSGYFTDRRFFVDFCKGPSIGLNSPIEKKTLTNLFMGENV